MGQNPGALHHVRYQDVRHLIRDADTLLYRRSGLIALAGRGAHSHAAKAAWWHDDLFCLEVREWVGGRAVTLSSQVRRFPGRIDVFETNAYGRWPNYDCGGAARYMRRLTGCEYGWLNLLVAATLHLPVVRLIAKPNLDDQSISRWPPFCSHAVAAADRLGGGVDPVRHFADQMVEPSDLARSSFYRYRFTLTP
jgi:hypothetical protein